MGYRKPMKPAITAAAGLVLLTAIGAAEPARAGGDPAKGREIAISHCARCHVIADDNPHGSIGSTAAFRMMTTLPDYVDRFRTFYLRRPHPVFTNVPEVAPLKRQTLSVTPFTVTLEDIQNLTAYAKSLHEKE